MADIVFTWQPIASYNSRNFKKGLRVKTWQGKRFKDKRLLSKDGKPVLIAGKYRGFWHWARVKHVVNCDTNVYVKDEGCCQWFITQLPDGGFVKKETSEYDAMMAIVREYLQFDRLSEGDIAHVEMLDEMVRAEDLI